MARIVTSKDKRYYSILDTYTKYSPQLILTRLQITGDIGEDLEVDHALIVVRMKHVPGCTHEDDMYPAYTGRVKHLRGLYPIY